MGDTFVHETVVAAALELQGLSEVLHRKPLRYEPQDAHDMSPAATYEVLIEPAGEPSVAPDDDRAHEAEEGGRRNCQGKISPALRWVVQLERRTLRRVEDRVLAKHAHLRVADRQSAEVNVVPAWNLSKNPLERVRPHNVVAAEQPAVLATSQLNAACHVPIDAAAMRLLDVANSGVAIRKTEYDTLRVVSRPSVEYHNLNVGEELRYDRVERICDKCTEVEGGNADRKFHTRLSPRVA